MAMFPSFFLSSHSTWSSRIPNRQCDGMIWIS
jgi:hypothetical protein